jgi:hypothetical protein
MDFKTDFSNFEPHTKLTHPSQLDGIKVCYYLDFAFIEMMNDTEINRRPR